jgi:hypothetical protein
MEPGTASIYGCITAVAIGSLHQVASQKATEGEDPLKTGMNKGKIETVGVNAFLVTFWAYKKPPADGIRGQPKRQS